MHQWAQERFAAARVARLATTSPGGRPHLVPVVFVVVEDQVWTVVDAKPKSTRSLRRLANIEADPRICLLVDHYADDWSALWWVRADGRASIVPVEAEEGPLALAALTAKYPQYVHRDPPGPLIRIEIDTWRAWSAQ